MDQFRGAAVLLDVNGTLLAASDEAIGEAVRAAAERLKSVASVHLFSNRPGNARAARVASSLGVSLVETRRRKPDPGVIRTIDSFEKPLVVIGDKVLTDGLLAYFSGARFVRVSRLRGSDDGIFTKALYALDDALAGLLK